MVDLHGLVNVAKSQKLRLPQAMKMTNTYVFCIFHSFLILLKTFHLFYKKLSQYCNESRLLIHVNDVIINFTINILRYFGKVDYILFTLAMVCNGNNDVFMEIL